MGRALTLDCCASAAVEEARRAWSAFSGGQPMYRRTSSVFSWVIAIIINPPPPQPPPPPRCQDRRELPFHKMLLSGGLPLTMGGGKHWWTAGAGRSAGGTPSRERPGFRRGPPQWSTPSSPKEREDAFVKDHPTTFLMGIGGKLRSGKPHDGRAPDYDDFSQSHWST